MSTIPPIVVILGHVDHGKTSLLDALRKTDIATSEVGGITQSTRAFQLTTHDSQLITFIDTPGHAAFSQMRSRGGLIAGLALLVVSVVDGVMPQTLESIATIKKAGIPMIAVITKTDLPGSSVEKIKSQLAENQVLTEGFGGDIPSVAVSAKTGAGLSDLLEMINLMSELHPNSANRGSSLEATVLESRLDTAMGPMVTVVIKTGTVSLGQPVFLGIDQIGKVKALNSTTNGQRIESAGPSTPVEILGLSQIPPVGITISNVPTKITPQITKPNANSGSINIILKADTLGSLEAISTCLPAEINVIFSATGDISESDVLSAQSAYCRIVGFGVKVPKSTAKLAESDKVNISTFNIIYDLLDYVAKLNLPTQTEVITGEAQILAEFKMNNQAVAGCECTTGIIKKGDTVRIGDKPTRIKSLKTGKTDVDSVKSGTEFGAIFSPQVDFKIGESIIAFQIHGTI